MFTKQTQEILWTKDYDSFSFCETNRDIDEKHISKKVIDSLSRNGWSISNPLIVDGDLRIRDGQHRFLAAKKLNLEIPVLIIENYNDELLFDINNASKKWTEFDKINYRAKKGDKVSQKVIYLAKKYKIAFRTLGRLLNISLDGYMTSFTDFNLEEAECKISKLNEVCSLLNDKCQRASCATIRILQTKGYDHQRMLNSLLNQKDRIYKCNSEPAYYELLGNIYNYRRQNVLDFTRYKK